MTTSKSFSFQTNAGRDLAVDVYHPVGASNRAAVVLLHGGAWLHGHRRTMAPYAHCLAGFGFTAIAAEYRFASEAIWPAQLVDVRSAFNWVVAEAGQLAINPAHIALQGFSAGGHLALMAASSALPEYPLLTRPGAVVSLFAPPELHLPPVTDGPNPPRLLLGPDADEAQARAASPIHRIGAGFPPAMLINGTSDPLVPHTAALALFGHLSAVGVPVDLQLFQGQSHEFAELPRMMPTVQAGVAAFLNRVMVDPASYEHDNQSLNRFSNPDLLASLAASATMP